MATRRQRRKNCRRKVRYGSYDLAVAKALEQREKLGRLLYVYECCFCRGYHLTKQPPVRKAAAA